jgi:hypothetical protein
VDFVSEKNRKVKTSKNGRVKRFAASVHYWTDAEHGDARSDSRRLTFAEYLCAVGMMFWRFCKYGAGDKDCKSIFHGKHLPYPHFLHGLI